MSAKGNAPNRRVAAIQAKKKRKQPKKSKTVGEGGQGGAGGKDRDRPARETRQEQEQSRSFEEVSINFLLSFILTHCMSPLYLHQLFEIRTILLNLIFTSISNLGKIYKLL